MGTCLNPGNGKFQESLNSPIYVDKTGLIGYTNSILSSKKKYICVSRPRRFGKTMAAEMLTAYYGRGCDSHAQFERFKLSENPDYETHINKYNVIQVSVSGYMKSCPSDCSVKEVLDRLYSKLTTEIEEEYPGIVPGKDDTFPDYLDKVYNKTDIRFVFVIDEWDAVFRDRKEDKAGQKEYLDRLEALFKDREYIALVYMTGILPIKKYGTHSALNMFTEISMTNASPLQEYMGFTEDEVMDLCEKHGKPYGKIKKWYDGYKVNGLSIYNPNSVICSMLSGEVRFKGYWTDTETYDALKIYIDTNTYGVQDILGDLLHNKSVKVDTSKFTNDMTTFESYHDVLTLLIHLGYLTYDKKTKKAKIPNYEIREQFVDTIGGMGLGNVDRAFKSSKELLAATYAGDCRKVESILEKIHEEETSIIQYNNENSLAFVIRIAYNAAKDFYSIKAEVPAGKGFADLTFFPIADIAAHPPMVIELKAEGAEGGAMKQILEKNYGNVLPGYHGDVILVGIHYNDFTKAHTCEIRRDTKD
ncbi:MAG: AAA family ATPase [Clostridia bacterium]|nr:AAA family ATPase [Clostridia bacterium]